MFNISSLEVCCLDLHSDDPLWGVSPEEPDPEPSPDQEREDVGDDDGVDEILAVSLPSVLESHYTAVVGAGLGRGLESPLLGRLYVRSGAPVPDEV